MKPKITELTPGEVEWIEKHLSAGMQLLAVFVPDSIGKPTSLRTLDQAYSTWYAQHDPKEVDPNHFINVFGILWGQYLVDSLKMRWVVASDEHGTQLAIHGSPNDILIYPPNFVGKRYSDGITEFFEDAYPQIREAIQNIRSGNIKAPWWKFWKR